MTAVTSRRRVRRCDVRCARSEFWQHDEANVYTARVVRRALEWADSHGVSPEEAELLRREIRSDYWEENVAALLGSDDPQKPSNQTVYRVFKGLDGWLDRWLRALSERAGEDFPSGFPQHGANYGRDHLEEVT